MILRETPVHNFIPQRSVYLNAILASRKQIVTQRRSSYAKRKGTSRRQGKRRGKYSDFPLLHRHSLRIGCTCGAKKEKPVSGLLSVCVWRDSNPRPSESESDALSSCATNTKYFTTILCFVSQGKVIF